MSNVKLNPRLLLLWLASCGALVASINPLGNTLWDNVIFMGFLLLLIITVYQHYRLTSKPREFIPEPLPEPNIEPVAEAENTVILLLGPYAAKWFNTPGATDSTRFSGRTAWILIPSPQALQRRLSHIVELHPTAKILAFFPFLPDVYENSSVIISQLKKWQNSFSDPLQRSSLPCVFAIYVQLSNERLSHDANNAYWTGKINVAHTREITLNDAMARLSHQFEQQDTHNTAYTTQRHALAQNLFLWLNESEVASTLQNLFTSTSLKLTNVIISDNGKGFTRHGSWSTWLDTTLGILPGLGSSLSLPPLPEVINDRKIPLIQKQTPSAVLSPRRPTWLFSLTFAAVLLAVHMVHTLSQEKLRHEEFNQQMLSLDNISELSVKNLAMKIEKLASKRKALYACINTFDLTHWGLEQCTLLLKKTNERIEKYDGISSFSLTQIASLFDLNSAKLKLDEQNNALLNPLLEYVKKHSGRKILIIGHSDNTGSDAFNMAISEQRALEVRNWLINHSTLSVNDFIIRGKGAQEPAASNDTKAGQNQNRRVEVLLLPINNKNSGV